MELFTDGSCEPNPGPGGWSFVVFDGHQEAHSATGADSGTTNNRMEMQAVLEALVWLGGRPATIYSDSKYVVDGINTWAPRWKSLGWKRKLNSDKGVVKNLDLWKLIDAAKKPGQVLEWVKGHAGVPGNERADELAEQARVDGEVDGRDLLLYRK